jgi:large subunit ribosomal protein L21
MDYAIIELNGAQYMVKPGDKITVNGVLGAVNDEVKNVKVLAFKDGTLKVGTPTLTETVGLKIVELGKSEKIRVATYRHKSRYRKVRGHRQEVTILEVAGGVKAEKPAKKVEAKAVEADKAPKAKAEKPAKKAEPKTAKAKKAE